MSMINKTLLPQVNIRKVYVNQGNVLINGFLTAESPGSDGSSFWMDEKYFSQYIDVYFVIDHLNNNLGRRLGDPAYRVATYAESMSQGYENWDFPIRTLYDNKIISLKDITDQESDIVVSESAIMSANPNDSGGMLRDIAFSIEIRLTKINFQPGTAVNDIALCAFTHLNFSRLVQDFNLSTNEDSYADLMKIGGNFVLENMLTVGKDASGTSVYRVPSSTTMLVYNDGTPFHGSYHYHGPNSEGPGGYVGWMEGSAQEMHADTRRLREVEIPYTKVVANFLLDDTLFKGNFDGSQELFMAPQEDKNPGYVYNPEYIRQKALEEFYNTDRRAPNVRNKPIVYDSLHFIKEEFGRVRCSLTFSIDFEEILKTRSRYPLFYERLRSWFNLNEQELLRRSKVTSFEITRFRLSNGPRSNNDVGTADYEKYSNEEIEETVFLASQPETSMFIFQSAPAANHWPPILPGQRPPYRNTIIRESTTADGTGGNIDTTTSDWYQRTYRLKDREMAKFNFGKFAYNVYIQMEDAVKEEIISITSEFRSKIKGKLIEFISQATMSRKEHEDGTVFNEGLVQGLAPPSGPLRYVDGYDYSRNQYTDKFKSDCRLYFNGFLEETIDDFVNIQGLIGTFAQTGNPLYEPDISEQLSAAASVKRTLRDQIIPSEGGDLDSVLNFAKHCDDLLTVLEDMLSKDSTFSTAVNLASDNTVLGQKNSSDKNLKNIDFKARIPGFTEAFRVGDVFVEYDIDQLTSLAGEVVSAPSVFRYIEEEDSAREILNVADFLNLPEITLDRRAASLENIIRTPPEFTLDQVKEILIDEPRELPTYSIPGLVLDPQIPGDYTLSADINLNLGNYSSEDISTPLGKNAGSAIISGTGNYSATKEYKKIEKNRKSKLATAAKNRIINKLSNKLAKGVMKGAKGDSTDIIKSKSKKLLVKQGSSPLATFVPVTVSLLKSMASMSDLVTVKVDDSIGSKEGSYRVISEPKKMTVSNVIELLGESDATAAETPRANTRNTRNTPSSSRSTLSTTRGLY